jgi:hypothetical protein
MIIYIARYLFPSHQPASDPARYAGQAVNMYLEGVDAIIGPSFSPGQSHSLLGSLTYTGVHTRA